MKKSNNPHVSYDIDEAHKEAMQYMAILHREKQSRYQTTIEEQIIKNNYEKKMEIIYAKNL